MQTTLTQTILRMPGRKISPASPYPAMREIVKTRVSADLNENDGLFVNYGAADSPLPYTMFDTYDGKPEELEFILLVLENDFLRAEFLPEVGGRLWRLYDKEKKRDVIYFNPEFLPCNLAIRNAWVAGGIEYNFGRRGHDAQTSDSRFAAEVMAEDGTPVLRFYEFNRDRAVPFQMDFYLPSDSRFLFNRVRVVNHHSEVIPMYYWANIALEETAKCRILLPADDAYTNNYNEGHHQLSHVSLPYGEGFDASYPTNFIHAKDHFYRIKKGGRRLETVAYEDNTAFVFASTERLQGRKLFVWGQHPGGQHWQKKLVGKNCPPYIEIQGGYTHTQMECLPMPPATAWEHVEAYGCCKIKYDDFTGDWNEACARMCDVVDRELPGEILEKILCEGKSFACKKGRVLHSGSGWGALERIRQQKSGGKFWPEHLDFGEITEKIKPWQELAEGKTIAEIRNGTYMVHPAMWQVINNDVNQRIHRVLIAFFRNDFALAKQLLATVPENDPLYLYVAGMVEFASGDKKNAAEYLLKAAMLDKNDMFLVKESLKIMLEAEAFESAVKLYCALPEKARLLPMVQFLYASALAHLGKLNDAENILLADGGLEIPDIREGENSVSGLYVYIREQKGDCESRITVPFVLDLRMRI